MLLYNNYIWKAATIRNLKDKDLQKAYNCIEPTDIIGKLFKAGEIGNIATAIMKCAGYESLEAKVHEEIKN